MLFPSPPTSHFRALLGFPQFCLSSHSSCRLVLLLLFLLQLGCKKVNQASAPSPCCQLRIRSDKVTCKGERDCVHFSIHYSPQSCEGLKPWFSPRGCDASSAIRPSSRPGISPPIPRSIQSVPRKLFRERLSSRAWLGIAFAFFPTFEY